MLVAAAAATTIVMLSAIKTTGQVAMQEEAAAALVIIHLKTQIVEQTAAPAAADTQAETDRDDRATSDVTRRDGCVPGAASSIQPADIRVNTATEKD